MDKKELSLLEMIELLENVSINKKHDTCIQIFKNGEVVREISDTSRLSIINGNRSIKIKSCISKSSISFVKSKILDILYVVYDLKMNLAYLQISDKKKIAMIMIDAGVLDEYPIIQ